MFTVMFAIARCVGWVTHWREMVADPETRIGRPRQLYVGARPARLSAISGADAALPVFGPLAVEQRSTSGRAARRIGR